MAYQIDAPVPCKYCDRVFEPGEHGYANIDDILIHFKLEHPNEALRRGSA